MVLTDAAPVRISWRVGLPRYRTDAAFDDLLALFERHAAVVDEVCLFETITHHLYLPEEELDQRAELVARRLRQLRECGVPSVGVNVLTTIGHLDEAWDTMAPLPFQPMIGHDGRAARGSACPNDPLLVDYIARKYARFAAAAPDFIWVDDDLRMHHHTIAWGCFCPRCLALFGGETGQSWTRAALVATFDEPAAGEIRAAWVERNIRSLESILAHIRRAVHGVDDGIELGLMTVGVDWTSYSGQDFDRWFAALGASKARPGGGFYEDSARLQILHKAFEVGRQRAALPTRVTDVQYELENFPYQRLAKAPRTVVHEVTLALAVGLGGVAMNCLGEDDDLAEHEPHVVALERARPTWERYHAHVRGLRTAGLWVAGSRAVMARRRVLPGERWLGLAAAYRTAPADVLAELGLPLAVDPPGCATVLIGRLPEAFTDAELETMLRGGLWLDGVSLAVIEERGLGELTGVRIAASYDNGLAERFTADPLNGPAAGWWRDARIEFWGDARGQAVELEPLSADVRVLARLEDYHFRPRGPCATVYENHLGGRVAVMGYAPWMFVRSGAKRAQLQNVAEWLSRGTLPLRIEETVTVTPFARLTPDGRRGGVVLLNHGLEPVDRVTVRLAKAADQVVLLGEDGERVLSGGERVVMEGLPAWTTRCLLLG